MAKFRISYNAPVVLTFAALAVAVFVITSEHVAPNLKLWFVAWPEFRDTRSYVGLVTHILGHANWNHLLGNFMLILLIGPILEERFGSGRLLMMILVTALVTGLINVAVSSDALLGASGIVFMMILLASTANIKQGEIPLTFIAVAVIYLGGEIVRAVSDDDQVSQMAHLIGGATGAVFGFMSAKRKPPAAKPSIAGDIAMPKPAAKKALP